MLNFFRNFIIVLNFKCFILNFFKNLFVVLRSFEIFKVKKKNFKYIKYIFILEVRYFLLKVCIVWVNFKEIFGCL